MHKNTTNNWRSKFGPSPVAFILGNEGGDLDSVVCAYTFAHLMASARHNLPRLASIAPWLPPLKEHIGVPLCNFPSTDLVLRQDVVLAFAKAGIRDIASQMIFSDQIPLLAEPKSVAELQPGDCVILVDHNVPTDTQMHLAPFVRGVVDHHELPPGEWPIKLAKDGSALEVIETVGSATSLIARLYRQLQLPLDPCMARLMLAPVLLDTSNFKPSAKKAVEGDFQARDFLCKLISAYSYGPAFTPDESATALFTELLDARASYAELTIAEALRKDTKIFTFAMPKLNRGTATATALPDKMVMPIASWGEELEGTVSSRFKLADIVGELAKFSESKGAHGGIITFHKGSSDRDMIFYAKTDLCRDAMKAMFLDQAVGLQFKDLSGSSHAFAFPAGVKGGIVRFADSTVSRKLLTPKMGDFFAAWSGSSSCSSSM